MITTQKVVFEKRASAFGGTYWTSNASKATLRQHLRDCNRTTLKTASIGGDQEASFEEHLQQLRAVGFGHVVPVFLEARYGGIVACK